MSSVTQLFHIPDLLETLRNRVIHKFIHIIHMDKCGDILFT